MKDLIEGKDEKFIKEVDTVFILNNASETLKKVKYSLPPDYISVKHELRLDENLEQSEKWKAYIKNL